MSAESLFVLQATANAEMVTLGLATINTEVTIWQGNGISLSSLTSTCSALHTLFMIMFIVFAKDTTMHFSVTYGNRNFKLELSERDFQRRFRSNVFFYDCIIYSMQYVLDFEGMHFSFSYESTPIQFMYPLLIHFTFSESLRLLQPLPLKLS